MAAKTSISPKLTPHVIVLGKKSRQAAPNPELGPCAVTQHHTGFMITTSLCVCLSLNARPSRGALRLIHSWAGVVKTISLEKGSFICSTREGILETPGSMIMGVIPVRREGEASGR